jgi:hypothetical protein
VSAVLGKYPKSLFVSSACKQSSSNILCRKVAWYNAVEQVAKVSLDWDGMLEKMVVTVKGVMRAQCSRECEEIPPILSAYSKMFTLFAGSFLLHANY